MRLAIADSPDKQLNISRCASTVTTPFLLAFQSLKIPKLSTRCEKQNYLLGREKQQKHI